MDKIKKINEMDDAMYHFPEELGNAIYEAFMEDDNYFKDIGKSVITAFNSCETEKEIEIADHMLIAVCGWGIETLMNRIKSGEDD